MYCNVVHCPSIISNPYQLQRRIQQYIYPLGSVFMWRFSFYWDSVKSCGIVSFCSNVCILFGIPLSLPRMVCSVPLVENCSSGNSCLRRGKAVGAFPNRIENISLYILHSYNLIQAPAISELQLEVPQGRTGIVRRFSRFNFRENSQNFFQVQTLNLVKF